MDNKLIIRAGMLLCGVNWRSGLARLLHVSQRTVSRWVRGDCEPPRELDNDLIRLCEQRRDALGLVVGELENHKTKRLDSEERQGYASNP